MELNETNLHDVPTAPELAGALTAQHGMIRLAFHDARHGSTEHRAKAVTYLLRLLAIHDAAEQLTIHRALAGAGGGLAGAGNDRIGEEEQSVQLIERLQQFEPGSYEFTMQLGLLEEAVMHHDEEEEATELPLFGDLDATERFRIGRALEGVITGLDSDDAVEYDTFSAMLAQSRSWLAG